MALRVGMVGLPGSGKTTIFNAITSAGAASFGKAELNRAIVNVPDDRLDTLAGVYHPQKVIPATLEVVDIPGLAAGSTASGGRGNRLLSHIKDVDALIHIVRCFEGANPCDPQEDVEIINLEMVTADIQTLQNKIDRLTKKSRTGDKDAIRELECCRNIMNRLEDGVPARLLELSPAEKEAIYECHLTSLKPILYIANVSSMLDRESSPVKILEQMGRKEKAQTLIVAGKDEAELSELDPDDRAEFMSELGISESSMVRLIRAAYLLLGLITFFTVGEDECRAWTCQKDELAPIAAGKIHTDMEHGFIRMEVITYQDLISQGSEEAVAKAGLKRLEGKQYQVQDGDIVVVLFNP